jgi:hypothetical protein
MGAMPTIIRRPFAAPRVLVVAGSLVVLLLVACGGPAPSGTGTVGPASASPAGSAPASAIASPPVELTPVPGGATGSPEIPDRPATTVTDWGTILDRVPEGFPVYPGARIADGIDEPVSGAWITDTGVDSVAPWYVSAFTELGWAQVDLGSALEDGSRVLALASDLPECRVQTTFRPAGESTMIIVLYGAGCAGGEG